MYAQIHGYTHVCDEFDSIAVILHLMIKLPHSRAVSILLDWFLCSFGVMSCVFDNSSPCFLV